MKKLIKKVLGLYKKFLALTVLGHSMVASSRATKEKIVAANAVSVSKDGIRIFFTRKQVMFWLTKLAPEITLKEGAKKHKPMLSFLPLQINLVEDEKVLYAPVVSINLEAWRTQLLEAVKLNDATSILVPWDTSLEINEDIINSSIVKAKNSFVKKDNEGKEVPYSISDLVPEASRTSLVAMVNSLASNFSINQQNGMKLKLSSGKMGGMFFEFTDQFQMRRELDSILANPSDLVKAYLAKNEADSQELNADYPIGHHAKSYLMASGQFDMSRAIWSMLKETTSNLIVTVLGGPGTGKSSALKNIFHSVQVNTAMRLMNNEKSILKLVLFTATANKPITGVVNGMKNVYMAGSKKVVELSKLEVFEMIEKITKELPNEEYKAKIKSKFNALNKVIENRTAMYKSIDLHGIHADFKDLENSLIEQSRLLGQQKSFSKSEKEEANKALFAILQITDKEKTSTSADINYAVDFINTNKDQIQYVASKIEAQGMMSKFFDKQVLELETGEVIQDAAEIQLLDHIVSTIDTEVFTAILDSKDQLEKKSVIDELLTLLAKSKTAKKGDKIESFEQQIISMMAAKSLEEYQRKALYNVSNKMSHLAEAYIWQVALSNKDKVLSALNVLVSNNRFEALIGQYGYGEKAHTEFLSSLALVYPITTSTLASVTSMFPGLNPSVKPYSIVIADEAGMISVQDILPALQRADKAVLVGDTQQLQPINPILEVFLKRLRTNLGNEAFWKKFSPSEVSAFHRASGLNEGGFGKFGTAIILDEHRRCLPGIFDLVIGNIVEYPGLTCETRLAKSDKPTYDALNGVEAFFFNVENSDKKSFVKTNIDEINKIDKILDRLEKAGFDLTTDVGIISPYKAQSNLLTEKFATRLGQVDDAEPRIGTVHKFQGAEYKVVIFSSVVSREDDSLNFINNGPYMINVAVTRAKNHFIMVGDFDKLTSLKSNMNYIGNVASKIETSDKGLLVR